MDEKGPRVVDIGQLEAVRVGQSVEPPGRVIAIPEGVGHRIDGPGDPGDPGPKGGTGNTGPKGDQGDPGATSVLVRESLTKTVAADASDTFTQSCQAGEVATGGGIRILQVEDGTLLALDGQEGQVWVNPKHAAALQQQRQAWLESQQRARKREADEKVRTAEEV